LCDSPVFFFPLSLFPFGRSLSLLIYWSLRFLFFFFLDPTFCCFSIVLPSVSFLALALSARRNCCLPCRETLPFRVISFTFLSLIEEGQVSTVPFSWSFLRLMTHHYPPPSFAALFPFGFGSTISIFSVLAGLCLPPPLRLPDYISCFKSVTWNVLTPSLFIPVFCT